MTCRHTKATLFGTLAGAALLLVAAAGSPATEMAAAGAGCPGQASAGAPAVVQERAMLCLVNRARGARGLSPLEAVTPLNRAADRKSGDILRCADFSHEACGHEFTYWMSRFGYHGCSEGENIAWGGGSLATPLSIFRAWMHSQGHRENILGPYKDTGIGLQTGTLEGHGAHVWTEEFGSRSC